MLDALLHKIGVFFSAIVVFLSATLFGVPEVAPVLPAAPAESPSRSSTLASTTPPVSENQMNAPATAPVAAPVPEPVAPPRETHPEVSVTLPVSPSPVPLPQSEKMTQKVESLPGPFRRTSNTLPSAQSILDSAAVIALTNARRADAGLSALRHNAHLAAMAEAKAVDMIHKQYFAHESPDGVGISGLAEKYGYAYRYVGENLAMGDFASSSHVVDGWMNSPGHRANILAAHYTEIGVAAVKGRWEEEGRDVWYVVQEFGDPMPDCPNPDELTRRKIEIFKTEIDALAVTLDGLRREVDALERTGPRDAYIEKVNDYNTVVAGYNDLIAKEKALIAVFNDQVEKYNICIGA